MEIGLHSSTNGGLSLCSTLLFRQTHSQTRKSSASCPANCINVSSRVQPTSSTKFRSRLAPTGPESPLSLSGDSVAGGIPASAKQAKPSRNLLRTTPQFHCLYQSAPMRSERPDHFASQRHFGFSDSPGDNFPWAMSCLGQGCHTESSTCAMGLRHVLQSARHANAPPHSSCSECKNDCVLGTGSPPCMIQYPCGVLPVKDVGHTWAGLRQRPSIGSRQALADPGKASRGRAGAAQSQSSRPRPADCGRPGHANGENAHAAREAREAREARQARGRLQTSQ